MSSLDFLLHCKNTIMLNSALTSQNRAEGEVEKPKAHGPLVAGVAGCTEDKGRIVDLHVLSIFLIIQIQT